MKKKKKKRTRPSPDRIREAHAGDICERGYVFRGETFSRSARTIDAVIATEQPVASFDLTRFDTVLDVLLMEGANYPEQLPLLDTHDNSSIEKNAGSTRNLRIEGDQLIGTNHFSRDALGDLAMTKVRDGHLTDNSIRYRPDNFVTIEPGKSASINGRSFSAPNNAAMRVVTAWTVKENSLTSIGADEVAKMRSQQTTQITETNIMDLTKAQIDFCRSLGHDDPENLSDEIKRSLIAQMDATRKVQPAEPTEPAVNPEQIRSEATRAELDRQRQIRDLAGEDIPADIVQECIDQARSVESCQGLFLTYLRENRATIGSPAIVDNAATAARADLEVGLMLRAGFDEKYLLEQYGEDRVTTGDKFRDTALIDLCVRALQMDNKPLPHGRDEIIRAGFSTATLPTILGAVANKSVLRGYQLAPATWREWCNVGSVNNFQTQTKVRLTDTGDLVKVNNAGEVAHGSAEQEKEEFSIDTYAKTFSITRQNIIDDNLNAFTEMPQKMGRRAGQKVSDLVYTHLLANGNMDDSVALFHATHSNLITSNALAIGALSKAIYTYLQQTDKNGDPVDVSPAVLLVPPELKHTAQELTLSDNLITGANASRGEKNVLKGEAKAVCETRLSNANFTGYSATSWYLMAAPSAADTLGVFFLNGRQTPTVERFQSEPGVLGVIFRVYQDVGVKSLDHRTMQMSTA